MQQAADIVTTGRFEPSSLFILGSLMIAFYCIFLLKPLSFCVFNSASEFDFAFISVTLMSLKIAEQMTKETLYKITLDLLLFGQLKKERSSNR